MNKGSFALFVALLLVVVGAQAIVVVKDTEKAILLKLGAFERTSKSGLNFKVPLMDTAIKFEGRLRTLIRNQIESYQANQNLY